MNLKSNKKSFSKAQKLEFHVLKNEPLKFKLKKEASLKAQKLEFLDLKNKNP